MLPLNTKCYTALPMQTEKKGEEPTIDMTELCNFLMLSSIATLEKVRNFCQIEIDFRQIKLRHGIVADRLTVIK